MRTRTEHESTTRRARAHRNPVASGVIVLHGRLARLLLTLVLAAGGAVAAGAAAEPFPGGGAANIGPTDGWLNDYKKGLEKAKKELEDAEDTVTLMSASSASPDDMLVLALHLDTAEAEIATILDPQVAPSLAPANAGTVDRSIVPATLEEYASTCRALIEEALLEAEIDPVGSADFVGTRLRTVDHLLPGYRAAAGL